MFIERLKLGFESHFCCLIVVGPWTHWLSIALFLSSSVSFISDIIKSRWSYYVTYSGFLRGIWTLSIALCIWNSVSYHIEGHLNWVLNFDVVYIAWHWYLYQDQISPQRKDSGDHYNFTAVHSGSKWSEYERWHEYYLFSLLSRTYAGCPNIKTILN